MREGPSPGQHGTADSITGGSAGGPLAEGSGSDGGDRCPGAAAGEGGGGSQQAWWQQEQQDSAPEEQQEEHRQGLSTARGSGQEEQDWAEGDSNGGWFSGG